MADDITGDLNEDRVSETNRENFEAPNIETAIGAAEPPLSKRDLKRLRKQEWFETQKKARRLKDKEKQKVRNVEYFKQTGQSIRKKREFLADALSRSVDINVVFDLSFADLMTSLDLGKLVKQIARCYSVNRFVKLETDTHSSGFQSLTAYPNLILNVFRSFRYRRFSCFSA